MSKIKYIMFLAMLCSFVQSQYARQQAELNPANCQQECNEDRKKKPSERDLAKWPVGTTCQSLCDPIYWRTIKK